MPFSIRPHRRFPVQCAVTYHAGPFLKLPLAYFSGFWLLITLFVLSSSPAYAEWVKISSNDTFTYYADPETIRRKGTLVKMWVLVDFKTIQTSAEGKSYLSNKAQREYDCAEEQTRRLSYYWYTGQMGKGEVAVYDTDPTTWQPDPPESVGQKFLKLACSKQ